MLSGSTSTARTSAWPISAPDPAYAAIDPNGNLSGKSEDGHSWSYEWNARNELTRVLKDGAEVLRFSYDPNGRRIEKVAGGATTKYVYAREDIVRQTVAGSTVHYVHGPGVDEALASQDGSGQIAYLHGDVLGSELKQTDGTGVVTFSQAYAAFGLPPEAASSSTYAFTGREWDAEVGLYYYRARYYDPKLGRFLGEDPRESEEGESLYVYVENDPVSRIDPSGTTSITVTGCGKDEKRVKKAIKKATKGIKNCLPCIKKDILKLTPHVDVQCVTWSTSNEGEDICGKRSGTTIYITPHGLHNPACGCLEATLMHEAMHMAGYRNSQHNAEGGFDLVKQCLKCGS